MAATFFKNYIVDSYSAKDLIALKPNLKEKLSLTLIELLAHESEVIHKMVSSSLELLVVKEYPNLFGLINNKIMAYLLSDNLLEVRGAIHFMRSLGCNQKTFCSENMYFSPEYIEPLLNILLNEVCTNFFINTSVKNYRKINYSSGIHIFKFISAEGGHFWN